METSLLPFYLSGSVLAMEDDMRSGEGGAVAIDMGGAVQSYMQVSFFLFEIK